MNRETRYQTYGGNQKEFRIIVIIFFFSNVETNVVLKCFGISF